MRIGTRIPNHLLQPYHSLRERYAVGAKSVAASRVETQVHDDRVTGGGGHEALSRLHCIVHRCHHVDVQQRLRGAGF